MQRPVKHLEIAQHLLSLHRSSAATNLHIDQETASQLITLEPLFSALPPISSADPAANYPTNWVEGSRAADRVKKVVNAWVVDEARYTQEESSTTTHGGPSEYAVQQVENTRRESLQQSRHNSLSSLSSSQSAQFHTPSPRPSHTLPTPNTNTRAAAMADEQETPKGDTTYNLLQQLIKALAEQNIKDEKKVCVTDLGYFYPNAPVTYGEEDMVIFDGKTYYRSVHLYINRIQNLIALNSWDAVKKVIDPSLLGEAQAWWNTQLSAVERSGYLNLAEAELIKALRQRFKPTPSAALAKLADTRYSIEDCRKQRSLSEYLTQIQIAAHGSGFTEEYATVLFAWRHITIELRQDVLEPEEGTSISDFMKTLLRHQSNWFDKYPAAPSRQQRTLASAIHRVFNQQQQQSYQTRPQYNSGFRQRDWNSPNWRNDAQGNPPSNPNNPYLRQPPQRQGNPFYQQQQQQPRPAPPALPAPHTQAPPNRYQPNMSAASGYRPPQRQLPAPPATSNYAPAYYSDFTSEHTFTDAPENGFMANVAPDSYPEEVFPADPHNHGHHGFQTHFESAEPHQQSAHDNSDVAEANLTATFTGVPATTKTHICNQCGDSFLSRNKLFKHIKAKKHLNKKQKSAGDATANLTSPQQKLPQKRSTASPLGIGTGFGYRGYSYATAHLRLSADLPTEPTCWDTGCSASLVDRDWLLSQLPDIHVRQSAAPLRVRGIAGNTHESVDYVILDLCIPGADSKTGEQCEAVISRELHLVNGLQANMLIGTDIMAPEKVDISLSGKKMSIGSCGVDVPITIRSKPGASRQFYPIHLKSTTVIPPHSTTTVGIHKLPQVDRDFVFEPEEMDHVSLFAHLVDGDTKCVLVKNETDSQVVLRRGQRLGRLHELDTELGLHSSAFLTTTVQELAQMAEQTPRRHHQGWLKKAVTVVAAAYAALVPPTSTGATASPHALDTSRIPNVSPATPIVSNETTLPNGITIYGQSDSEAVQAISAVVADFPEVFQDRGTVIDIPEDEWMTIPLRSDWESRMPAKGARVYPVSNEAKQVIDDTFDALHEQGRMSWSTKATQFSWPVFVVYKTTPDGKRKGRAVVDIRGLNQLALADVYPVPLQSDIIAAVHGCKYITVVDCASFFYQWAVAPSDRHKLSVVTHRGQEQFNVAVIGFKNSVSYVQRQIDRILRPFQAFSRAYIDDVVIYSQTLEEHVQHLREIFATFRRMRISIKPTKAFLGFPSVRLLGQLIDSFGLATAEDKLLAISQLKFPDTLQDLEHYLGLTGYLRQYVEFYAALAEPLTARKTKLLRHNDAQGSKRRQYVRSTRITEPTPAELASFEELQKALSSPTLLVHHNPARDLYIDVDSSKEFGMGAIVYHVKEGTVLKPGAWPKRTEIEPILFLSRLLHPAEKNYWPTELEVAGMVWVVRKVKHMVESSQTPAKIFTDHGAIIAIAKQRSLETESTDRANLRLISASHYLQQFKLEIFHKPGREHTIPDALSRLQSFATAATTPELDFEGVANYNVTASLPEMTADFRAKLQEGYKQDKAYRKILPQLQENETFGENKADLKFFLDDGLIWHRDDARMRLCIPDSLVKDVLTIEHTHQSHHGTERTFHRANSTWYIKRLSKHVESFIKHCPECIKFNTKRHKPYGNLQPIDSPAVPFHTISIDFILALPVSREGFDAVLTVTEKFSKRITLIPGKSTWTAKDWANALIERLWIADWGTPKVILSDRDRKFLSAFWKEIFDRLGVALIYSTAYHPQTDGASERTNQTVEIALRYYLAALLDESEWPHCLPNIQSSFNNSVTATGRTPNEICYNFTPNFTVNPSNVMPDISFPVARIEVKDAIDLANMKSKQAYDRKHAPMFFQVGDYVNLRLHKGYKIPSVANVKLGQQYVGSFRVIERVGRLAYRLELPAHWKVHDVISIGHLEPGHAPGTDPYNRPEPSDPPPIDAEQNRYEVEKILDKMVFARGKGKCTKYLIRWSGYGEKDDTWENVKNLNCDELIQEYESQKAHGYMAHLVIKL